MQKAEADQEANGGVNEEIKGSQENMNNSEENSNDDEKKKELDIDAFDQMTEKEQLKQISACKKYFHSLRFPNALELIEITCILLFLIVSSSLIQTMKINTKNYYRYRCSS